MNENDENKPQTNFCEICQHRFLNEYNFKKHMWRHGDCDQNLYPLSHLYPPKRFACIVCESTFPIESLLRVHLLSHTDEIRAFNCDLCGAKFVTVASLLEHSLAVHKEDKKPIDVLIGLNKEAGEHDIRIVNARSVRDDISQQSADGNMEICITDARSIGNDPSKSSSSKRPIILRGLSAKFHDKRAVKVTNIRTVKDLSIKHAKTLKAQSLKISKASNTMSLSLEDVLKPCFVNLGSKCTTNPNVRSFKLSNVTKLVSPCLKDFLKPCFVNLGPKKYGCDVCHRTFLTEDNYELHLAIHDLSKLDDLPLGRWRKILPRPSEGNTKKEPKTPRTWKCIFCKQVCKSRDSLQYHVKIHYKEAGVGRSKLKSPELLKLMAEARLNAAKSMELEKSMEITKPSPPLKPFVCSICFTGFLKEDTLRMHSLTHNKLKKFTCTVCSKEFSSITLLQRHYLLDHKGVEYTRSSSDSLNKTFDQYKGKIAIRKPPEANSTTEGNSNSANPSEDVTIQKNQAMKDNSTGSNVNGATKESNEMDIDNSTGGCDVTKASNEKTYDLRKGVTKQGNETTEDTDMAEDSYSVDDNDVDDPSYQTTDSSEDDIGFSHKESTNAYSREKKLTTRKSTLRTEIVESSGQSNKCTICNRTFWGKAGLRTHIFKAHPQEYKSLGHLYSVDDNDVDAPSYQTTDSKEHKSTGHSYSIDDNDVDNPSYQTTDSSEDDISFSHKKSKNACSREKKIMTKKSTLGTAIPESVECSSESNKCDACNTIFRKKIDLQRHKRRTHPEENKSTVRSFDCRSCSSSFKLEKSLRLHQLTHSDVKTFICSTCLAEFNRIPLLQKHCLMVHKSDIKAVTISSDKKKAVFRIVQPSNEKVGTADNITIEYEGAETASCPINERPDSEASNPHDDNLVSFQGKASNIDHDYFPKVVFAEITCTPEIDNMTKHSAEDAEETNNSRESSAMHGKDNAEAEDGGSFGKNIEGRKDDDISDSSPKSSTSSAQHGDDTNVNHMRSHTKPIRKPHTNPKLKCSKCPKSFTSAKVLESHVCNLEVHPYVCEVCGQGFRHSTSLSDHFKRHGDPSYPYECEDCHRVFKQKTRLGNHACMNSKEPQFGCGTCNQSFFSKDDLKKHEEQHNSKASDLSTHQKRRNNPIADPGSVPLFGCGICHECFFSIHELAKHQKQLHNLESDLEICQEQHDDRVVDSTLKPLFSCSVCDERFFSLDNLKRHLQQHKKLVIDKASAPDTYQKQPNNPIADPGSVPLFGCGICHECFFSANELAKHRKQKHNLESDLKIGQEQHDDRVVDPALEPSFGCSVCDERFFSSDDLKEHLQQHKKLVMDAASGSLYCCNICNECFFVKRELMKHLEQHNEEVIDKAKDPRYRCDTCNESFVFKGDLRKHQKQHKKPKQQPKSQVANESKDRLFQCGICKESFFLIRDYSNHHRQHKIQDIKSKKEAETSKIISPVHLDTETDSLLVSRIEEDPSTASNKDAKPTTTTGQTVKPTVVSDTTTTGQTVEHTVVSDTTTTGQTVKPTVVSKTTTTGQTVEHTVVSDTTTAGQTVKPTVVSDTTTTGQTVEPTVVSDTTTAGQTVVPTVVCDTTVKVVLTQSS